MEEKIVLTKLNEEELIDFLSKYDDKKFRINQIINWIYNKSASSFDEMTDVKKELREKLKNEALITDVKIKTKQVSRDGTIKYLLEYSDGNVAECVLMRFDNRGNLTACVSSQIGCPMGCIFCATGQRGFIRNMLPYEIAEQILTIQRDTKLKVTNVVFMGQGEPLNNYENVYRAIEIINSKLQIGIRRITVSTCGIAPKIKELAQMQLIPTLAISLHAPNSLLRKKIMPVEKKYNLDILKEALKFYIEKTGKRITLEYVLIGGLNDTKEIALELINYMKDLKCNVNLIPYNPVLSDCDIKLNKPDKKDIMLFKYLLESSGKKVTVRLERGADIDAACGQLSGRAK
ncbi:TPA: 23S rRNA (adenine(2503)-C(2))-methyltransferase RlmN [Candidatus Galligastranaerophilus gallistercoris]|nr:23S rRNA (adenine(2503)-C(2))-methyltransferase RlmN [Candidatus Galligastranaerophilus gallistercoris]